MKMGWRGLFYSSPKQVWDDPSCERLTPLIKGTELKRLMDEISLTFYIGNRTEVLRQKRVIQLKGGETGHPGSQDSRDAESG